MLNLCLLNVILTIFACVREQRRSQVLEEPFPVETLQCAKYIICKSKNEQLSRQ